MKKLKIFIALLLFQNLVFAQKNEILLRVQYLGTGTDKSEFFTDDLELLKTPTREYQYKSYGFDCSYLREYKKVDLFFRAGISDFSSKYQTLSSGEERSRESERTGTGGENLTFQSGFYFPIFENEKFVFRGLVGVLGGVELEAESERILRAFDETNSLTYIYETSSKSPGSTIFGLKTGVGFQYYFWKNIGFGFDLEQQFSFQKTKGDRLVFQSIERFEEGEEDETFGYVEKINNTRFSFYNRTTFGLSYRF